MGVIIPVRKWNLKNSSWDKVESHEDRMCAYSIVSYGDVKHDDGGEVNYIIIADGCRVENHTRNPRRILESTAGISNVIQYFENKQGNYRIELILVDKDAPLDEESKRIAHYIDCLSGMDNVKTINFLGFSKCGVLAFNMMKYFKRESSLSKARVYSISSPYRGTVMTSPLYFEQKLKLVVEKILGKNVLSQKIIEYVVNIYRKTLSNSHMDYDIAQVGGVPNSQIGNYDADFLGEIFSCENIEAAKRVAHYENIFTHIERKAIIEAIKSLNIGGLGMILLDKLILEGDSDGLVGLDSQVSIVEHVEDLKYFHLVSVHNSLRMSETSRQILDRVADGIEPKVLKFEKR